MSTSVTRSRIREELAVRGVPFRIACPECNGGSSSEMCMTVFDTEDGTVLATCHRAQCSLHTISVQDGHLGGRFNKIPDKESDNTWREVGERSVPVPEELLTERYEFMYKHEGRQHIRYDPLRDRLVFPLKSRQGELHSIVTKALHVYQNPKSLFIGGPNAGTGMGWYVHGYKVGTVVVVEDCLSAIALFDVGCNAVSLNGTHINHERIHELRKGAERVVLCLDADATRQAARTVRKYMGQMDFTMRRLLVDLKDSQRQDVNDFVLSL